MNQDRAARARQIFMELVGLPAAERATHLQLACEGDAALRGEVESLLAADALAGGFLSRPTATAATASSDDQVGARIGPYKLLQQIGEGGFGTVYLAEQTEPIRRRVAVKILKPGMETRQVIARFEAERQALALMDHPHIASVLDAGATPNGRPYFVMEYVVGDAITTFADAQRLSVRARLALLLQVCSAVQHAHTKGIIHRDIKPGNVLVSLTDGQPFARVIDFGIAKATAAALTDKTLFTEHHQLIGTLEYMSPEQAEGLPDIDTRTDVYSLGVLLYELLTGHTPLDGKRLRSAAWHEIRRIIQEEEPPMPSVRVQRTPHTETDIARRRGAEPLALNAQIRGELDWITVKALDKDRKRRFGTAVALAEDIQRHLDGAPVSAVPPSRVYRWRKFVRRNRGSVAAVAAVGFALVLGVLGTGLGLWRAERVNRQLVQQSGTLAWAAYDANLSLAQLAMDNGNWYDARHRLAQCPHAKRGWEWEYLAAKADGVLAAFPSTRAVLSPDGKTMATAQTNSNVILMDLDGRPVSRPLLSETEGRRWVRNMAWAGDSRLVVQLREPAELMVLDRTGRVLVGPLAYRQQPTHERWAELQVSPNGRWILLGEARENLTLLNTNGRRMDFEFPHDSPIRQAAFSPDSSRIVTYAIAPRHAAGPHGEGVLRIWDLDGVLHAEIPQDGAREQDRFTLVFSPDGKCMFVACRGQARVYDLNGNPTSAVMRDDVDLLGASFSPDSALILTYSPRGAQLWNIDGTRHGDLIRDGSTVSAAFATDGQTVLTASYGDSGSNGPGDRAIRRWDLQGRPVGAGYELNLYPQALVAVQEDAVLLKGSFLDYVTERICRIALPLRTADRDLGLSKITPLRGAAILNLSPDEYKAGKIMLPEALQLDSSAVASAVTTDGSRVVTAVGDTITFWEPKTGRKLVTLRTIASVRQLAFSPDGGQLLIRGVDMTLALDVRSAERQAQDAQRHWAARQAAQGYVDTLLAGPLRNDELLSVIVEEETFDPGQRLAAAELLMEELADCFQEARRAFEQIKAPHDEPAVARQRIADADLPRRVKEHLAKEAALWLPPE